MKKASSKQFVTIIYSLLTLSVISQNDVMNYEDLQNYLPKFIDEYSAGTPDGQTMTMQGLAFSSAEIKFTNDKGGYIRITLLDYSAAISMYQAATAMWSAGMSFEDEETMARSVQLTEKIYGWEEYRKKDKEAKLSLGLGDRFFLSIEANHQSGMEFVNSVANTMKLNELVDK